MKEIDANEIVERDAKGLLEGETFPGEGQGSEGKMS